MRHSPPHALPHTRYFLPVRLRFYFRERTRDLPGASAPTQPREAPSGTQKRARQAPTGEGKTENHRGGRAGHFLLTRGVAWFLVALRLSSSAKFFLPVRGGFLARDPGLPALCWSRASRIKAAAGISPPRAASPTLPDPPPCTRYSLVPVKQRGHGGPTGLVQKRARPIQHVSSWETLSHSEHSALTSSSNTWELVRNAESRPGPDPLNQNPHVTMIASIPLQVQL